MTEPPPPLNPYNAHMSFILAPRQFPTEPRRLRTFWRFLIFGSGFLTAQVILGTILAVVLIVYLAASGQLTQAAPPDIVTDLQQRLQSSMLELQLIAALPSTLLSFLLCIFCRRFLDRRPIRTMGLIRPPQTLTAGIIPGFLLGLAPILVTAGIVYLSGGYHFVGFKGSWLTAAAVPALILMAFQEEIVFRGYVLQNLIDIRRSLFGLLFSSVVFWLVHSSNPAVWQSPFSSINLFGAGIILALAYRLSGNIWFPTAMHFAWNFAQGIALSIPVSGLNFDGIVALKAKDDSPTWLTGGDFGLEGSAVTTIMEIFLIAILVFLIRAQPTDEPENAEPVELDDEDFTDPPTLDESADENGTNN